MHRFRLWIFVLAVLLVPAALSVWALSEARSQQREVQEALRAEATLLAHSLGPALASASASSRELDELLAEKLLDNARLLARLESQGPLREQEMENLMDANGLDAVRRFGTDGAVLRRGGGAVDEQALRSDLGPLLRGEADELILTPRSAAGAPVIAAAVTVPGGGAMVVLADPGRVLTRQIGVGNLLRSLVDTRAVLYLAYDEQPGGEHAEAAWDGGRVPASLPEPVATVRGRPVFEVAVPVSVPAGRKAALRVGLNGEPLRRAMSSALRRTALVGLVLAAFALASAGFTVVQRARAREREQSRSRLADLEEGRRRGERLAAAGALAAGLAHEVRNPLNGIGMAAQRIERLARAADGDTKTHRLASIIRQEVIRLEATLKGFLDLARPSSGRYEPADLGALCRDSLELLELEAAEKPVRLAARTEPAPVLADAAALRGAVLNLLRNALQATPPGGRIEVVVTAAGGADGMARVTVRDQGAGIDPGLLERVFDAFVTTRAGGSGLGLAMVRRVADEHGGRSFLRNHQDGGVEAILEIPARAAEVA